VLRTVFTQKIVSAPYDELGDQTAHLLQLVLAFLLVLVVCIGITSPDDDILKVFSKVGAGAKEVGVSEIKEREVLGEVVLSESSQRR